MAENNSGQELRSLALTPTWSVATVLTVFVAVSLIVERSIHRLSTVSSSFNSLYFPYYEVIKAGAIINTTKRTEVG